MTLAFDSLLYCLENICAETAQNPIYTRQYNNYIETFRKSMSQYSYKDEINKYLNLIMDEINPYLKRNLPVDYKKLDESIIRHLPFIIHNHPFPSLVMPLEILNEGVRDTTNLYKNVASAAVLLPVKIDYLYDAASHLDIDSFKNGLVCILRYFDQINLKTTVRLHILVKSSEQRNNIKNALKDKPIQLDFIEDWSAIESLLMNENQMTLYDSSTSLFSSKKEEVSWINSLKNHNIAVFEYSPATQSFNVDDGCEYLKYNIYHPKLTIKEMLSFNGLVGMEYHTPRLERYYKKLWEIYTGDNSGSDKIDKKMKKLFQNGWKPVNI